MVQRVDKVMVSITRGERLLVFTQPAYPEAGTQVPAGTVEVGEALEAARRGDCLRARLGSAERGGPGRRVGGAAGGAARG